MMSAQDVKMHEKMAPAVAQVLVAALTRNVPSCVHKVALTRTFFQPASLCLHIRGTRCSICSRYCSLMPREASSFTNATDMTRMLSQMSFLCCLCIFLVFWSLFLSAVSAQVFHHSRPKGARECGLGRIWRPDTRGF